MYNLRDNKCINNLRDKKMYLIYNIECKGVNKPVVAVVLHQLVDVTLSKGYRSCLSVQSSQCATFQYLLLN